MNKFFISLLLFSCVISARAASKPIFQIGNLTFTGATATSFSPGQTSGIASVDRIIDNHGLSISFDREINVVFGGFNRSGTQAGFSGETVFSSTDGFVRFYSNAAGTFGITGDLETDTNAITSGELLLGGVGHLDDFGNTATGVVSSDNYTSSGSLDFIEGSFLESFDNNEATLSGADGLFTINGSRVFDLGDFNYLGVSNVTTQEIQPVPVPASLWLFGSAIVGFLGIASKKDNSFA